MKKDIEEKTVENASFVTKSEMFFEKNWLKIVICLGIVLLIVLAIFGIKKFVNEPKQAKADEAIFAAEQYFAQGDYHSALYGDSLAIGEPSMGLLEVIDEYGNTDAGRRAKYEAGICFLRLGDFKEGLKFLDKYNGKDQLTPIINEMLKGDAEVEAGNNDAALNHYNKAIKMDSNPLTTPFALFKAGMVYLMTGNNAKAAEYFKRVKEEYPESPLYSEMDGLITFAENL